MCGLLDEKNITKDEKWWECVELTALDLSNNLITAIPDAINNLTALGVLLMNHNKLGEVDVCTHIYIVSKERCAFGGRYVCVCVHMVCLTC